VADEVEVIGVLLVIWYRMREKRRGSRGKVKVGERKE